MRKIEERYYFAYGSNMNLEQMKYRCPAAEVVENVRLEDYRLAFRGRVCRKCSGLPKRHGIW